MSSFEVVESLPSGRANRHHDLLDEFMKANVQFAKIKDKENVRAATLTLLARQRKLPVRVHTIQGEIYLERTDEIG